MDARDPDAIYSLITAEQTRNHHLRQQLKQLYSDLQLVEKESSSLVGWPHQVPQDFENFFIFSPKSFLTREKIIF